ncbi:hypothetical protein RFI_11463 [Reticulomyxa filosa]|uniref:Uncharacterized protein n=1 Tax=Reticulomyxa filosa TaxID=46433 RepID=X6NI44_RETFI|nr:hypothetical protein RFI_11463 [Reticulomyxa filosa]|eukprot:ETO25676.1 hypothetical protein RFI_11463 [Reticulomyxa filosa]
MALLAQNLQKRFWPIFNMQLSLRACVRLSTSSSRNFSKLRSPPVAESDDDIYGKPLSKEDEEEEEFIIAFSSRNLTAKENVREAEIVEVTTAIKKTSVVPDKMATEQRGGESSNVTQNEKRPSTHLERQKLPTFDYNALLDRYSDYDSIRQRLRDFSSKVDSEHSPAIVHPLLTFLNSKAKMKANKDGGEDMSMVDYPQPYDYGPNYRVSFPIQNVIQHIQKSGCKDIKVYDVHTCDCNMPGFGMIDDKDWLITAVCYNYDHLETVNTRKTEGGDWFGHITSLMRQAHLRKVYKDSYYKEVYKSDFGNEGGGHNWTMLDLADSLVLLVTLQLRNDVSYQTLAEIEQKFGSFFYGIYHTSEQNHIKMWNQEEHKQRAARFLKKFGPMDAKGLNKIEQTVKREQEARKEQKKNLVCNQFNQKLQSNNMFICDSYFYIKLQRKLNA